LGQTRRIFQRKVDLLTISSIKNPILRKNIDATKIYFMTEKSKKVSFWCLNGDNINSEFTFEITDFNMYKDRKLKVPLKAAGNWGSIK
jgi:hypothetical protein